MHLGGTENTVTESNVCALWFRETPIEEGWVHRRVNGWRVLFLWGVYLGPSPFFPPLLTTTGLEMVNSQSLCFYWGALRRDARPPLEGGLWDPTTNGSVSRSSLLKVSQKRTCPIEAAAQVLSGADKAAWERPVLSLPQTKGSLRGSQACETSQAVLSALSCLSKAWEVN